MTNFLVELWEIAETVEPIKRPFAVIAMIVFLIPAWMLASFIKFVDWMLSWTWEGVRLVGRVLIGLACFVLMFWALFQIDNLVVVFALMFLDGVIFQQLLYDFFDLYVHLRRSG